MLVRSQEQLSCDVLVIGGGGAGLRAAIAAGLCEADVLLISKSKVGPNSNTYISKAVIAATGLGTPDDDQHLHTEDTITGGRFLNDQPMVARVADRSRSEITFLRACGVNFDVHDGRLRLIKIPGHRYPRHVHGTNWSGRDLVVPLKRRARQVGVRFAEKIFVSRLMTADDRICGAAGITSDGRFYAIRAKVVVLATGGYAQIYLNTNNVPGITGDGQALAYHVGVQLKDMEFVQFYPTAAGKRGSRLILYEKMLAQPGVTIRNGKGENIFERSGDPDPTKITRDRLAQLITNEIMQGASQDQEVFMDMGGLPEESARQLASILPSRWFKGQKVFKVTPTTHFCMGGIVTDQWGETSVKGLFAVGEAAAGVHGANRLGGNALAEVFAMGSWVGKMAAERSTNIGTSSVPKNAFEIERSRLERAYSNEGKSTKELINELKLLMWEKAGVIRHAKGLGEALTRLEAPWPRVVVSDPAELIRFLEFQNMRCAARLVCRAAIERTESRGSHFRSDYPLEDNRRWLKNIVLRKSDAGIGLEARPVGFDFVEPV
jgi:succinate dehydrogenase/fumarate reductase flavoprotein subunit